jgi:hypothetical protein
MQIMAAPRGAHALCPMVLPRLLETNTMDRYLSLIGVAGECSTRAFATAEVVSLLLTTDVLALV